MRTLVTGGCGFIGSHLTEILLDRGHEVIIIDDLSCGRKENISHLISNKNLRFVKETVCNRQAISRYFDGIDWVFHLAGIADIVPSIERPDDYFNINVAGTLNVLQAARSNAIKKLVYAASSSSYGIPNEYPTPESSTISPQYPYALTKYMGEELVLHWSQVYGLPAISLRLFNVYGPRSRTTGAYGAVFGVFLAQKRAGRPFTVVGDGSQSRDFTYVTDVAEAFVAAAENQVSGHAMNVGSGNHYSVNMLVKLLGGDVVNIPKRPGEPDCTFADTTKISDLLGWKPKISFQEGVANMLLCIDNWKEAPVWEPASISEATSAWFKYLGEK